VEAGVYARVG